jgi:type IV secretory pathway TraG/TraD family ATPase VirD4
MTSSTWSPSSNTAALPRTSAEDKRLYTALAVLGVFVALLAGAFWLAVALVSVTTGGPFVVPVADMVPTARAHPVAVSVLGTLGLTLVTAPLVLAAAWAVQNLSPTLPGHATGKEIRAELSEQRARATAVWTRPGLTEAQRKACPVADVAVPLHADEHRRPLWLPLENPSGVIAPTQSGKSRRDLIHKILAAPGGMLVSTTKSELFLWTAMTAHRRGVPVLLFDVTGSVDWPAQVRWSPVAGCEDPTQAMRRAKALVDAAAVDLGKQAGGNERTFRTRAYGVIRSYLVAAAISESGVGTLVDWSSSLDDEPVLILADRFPQLSRNLRSEMTMVAETRDAVWMSVRKALEPFLADRIQALCSPEPGTGFDAEAFIRSGGALYLVAGEETAADVAPVLTALVDHVITTARDLANLSDQQRLDPVFSVILDELPTATPVPSLPATCADSAGRGVLIHWAAQSRAQLEEIYGQGGARSLIENTTALVVFGGIKDDHTLGWLSKLCGDHDVARTSRSSSGRGVGKSSTTTALQRVAKYQPADIREIPRDRALIIFRHLSPILARTTDVAARPDADDLTADRTRIRDGHSLVDHHGYPLPTVKPALNHHDDTAGADHAGKAEDTLTAAAPDEREGLDGASPQPERTQSGDRRALEPADRAALDALIGGPTTPSRRDEEPAPEVEPNPDPVDQQHIKPLLTGDSPGAEVISLHARDRRPR